MVVIVRSRLIGFDRSMEEAAQDLGAKRPDLPPDHAAADRAGGAGGALDVALSLDDVVITNLNAGSAVTYTLYIWGPARVSIPPQVNVMAAMILLFMLAMMLLTVWQQRRAERLAQIQPEER